mgnify:CR=1 FL=1
MDLIISIISLILSLGIYIGKAIENYKNVWFRFNKFSIKQNVVNTYCETLNLVIIPFMVINKSNKPVSITRVQLVLNDLKYDAEQCQYTVGESIYRKGNEICEHIIVKSDVLPLYLEPLGAKSGYFAFLIPQGKLSTDETVLNFQICTNRGKAVQKSFALCEDVRLT